MHRRMSTQASTLIIFISILTVLVQFAAYQAFDSILMIWGISCLISIIGCHILLEQTGSYHACFDYTFLTLFLSLTIILLTWQGNTRTFLPFTDTMFGIALINWLIPMLHCFFRNMLNYGSKVDSFGSFYINSSIIFLIAYAGVFIYSCFFANYFPWAAGVALKAPVFSPFEILSGQIEDYFNGTVTLDFIITYLSSRVLIYIPYGFYIGLLLRRQGRLLRFFLFLILPVLIETIQYFIITDRCNFDDMIYGLIGGFLGCFLFFLTNVLFRAFSGKDFLTRGSDYHGMGNKLYY